MRRTVFLMLLLLTLPACAASVLRSARESIKKGANLAGTEKTLLAEAVKPSTTHADQAECYRLAAECNRKLHAQQNVKLYLKQQFDTVQFYATLLNVFKQLELCDSVEQQPDEKGRVRINNRKKSREILLSYRRNLYNGGVFHYRKHAHAQAFSYFDRYVGCASHPIFTPDSFATTDSLLPRAAYLAVVSAFQAKQYQGVIRHANLARTAGLQCHLVQEYLCRSYEALGDSLSRVDALWQGLRSDASHPYFFSNLQDYLVQSGQLDKALAVADSMIQTDSRNPLYWYARSLVLLKQERDREAIDACDSCIVCDSNYVDAYYNKGIASLNLAVVYTEQACTDLSNPKCLRDQQIIRSLYTLAKLPMEKVRQLEPDNVGRWGPPLYRIYLHLNMGREFDEIDRLLPH